jgi:chromosomal replication initiator protein
MKLRTRKYFLTDEDRITFKLEDFVVGPSNVDAVRVLLELVEDWPNRKKGFQIFLTGATGLGKGHLLAGVAQKLFERCPKMKISRMSAEEFFYAFSYAVKNNDLYLFRAEYESLDFLFIESFTFLYSSRESEFVRIELERLAKCLFETRSLFAVDSDLSMNRLSDLDTELSNFLTEFLSLSLTAPNFIERRHLVQNCLRQRCKVVWSEDLIDYFAAENLNSGRLIEGTINRFDAACCYYSWDRTLKTAQDPLFAEY